VAQQQRQSTGWGLGDVVLWFFVGQAAAVLVGGILLGIFGYGPGERLPLWLVAVLQLPLWAGYLGGPVLVTRAKGQGPVRDLGARIEAGDVLPGLALGVALQLAVIPLLYHLVILRLVDGDLSGPARDLIERADDPVGVVLLVLIAGVGAPLIEELFFRGFLLRGLLRRMGPVPAVLVSSVVFAAVHRQPLQFPALLVFGLVAGWLTVRTGRLGPAWAAHVAFNVVTIVLLLSF
jgi:uncharacterized protein